MGERSLYVRAYDIADNTRRAKLARKMEAVGERVQESVFEAYLTPEELTELLRKSKKWMVMREDSLRVYFLCAECRQKILTHGVNLITQPPGVVIV